MSLFDTFAALGINADQVKIPKVAANATTFNNIVGIVYVVIGAIALFYLVRGALLFVTSGSDPGSVKAARETILYAVIGLGASTAVFGLIQFVIGRV